MSCPHCERNCQKCTKTSKCPCKTCGSGSTSDIWLKAGAIVGGLGLVGAGIAATVLTSGLAAPIIAGAAIGTGISSTYVGAEKSIKGERLDGKDYAVEVATGALIGVATGGIGSTANAVVMKGVTNGAVKLAARVSTGAVAGVAQKVILVGKECATTDKSLKECLAATDDKGNVDVGRTLQEWSTPILTGAIGGCTAHASSNLSKLADNGIAKAALRTAASGIGALGSDLTAQGLEKAVGKREEFSIGQALTGAAISMGVTASLEGAKNAKYHSKGGKHVYLKNEANNEILNEVDPEHAEFTKEALKDPEFTRRAEADLQNGVKYGKGNIHRLQRDHLEGYYACDTEPRGPSSRSAGRVIFELETTKHGPVPVVVGNTQNHDYKSITPDVLKAGHTTHDNLCSGYNQQTQDALRVAQMASDCTTKRQLESDDSENERKGKKRI